VACVVVAALAMPSEFRRVAAASKDAFDAAVSALVMSASADELLGLRHEPDYALEGKIWQARALVDLPEPVPNRVPPPARLRPRSHGLLPWQANSVVHWAA
jgi:hypothetical protein